MLAVGRVSEQRLYALSWKLVRCRLPLGKEMLQVALLLAQITLVWPRLSAPLIGDGTVTTLPTVLFVWDIKDLKRLMLADQQHVVPIYKS